jgi:ankyrin repeat protein
MLDHARGQGRYELSAYLVERGATADIFLSAALGLTHRIDALLAGKPSLLDLRTDQGAYGEKPPSSYHIYFWTIGSGRSPLDVAAQFDQHDTLNAMLEYASPIQRLLFASSRGDAERARSLTREHAGLVASLPAEAHRALADAAWAGNAPAVAVMIELGFDPRATGHDSGTALHCAAWEGSAPAVAAILRHPAARELVTLRDANYNATPLGWCCHGSLHGNRSKDHAGVARLLIGAGARQGPDTADASATVRAAMQEAVR